MKKLGIILSLIFLSTLFLVFTKCKNGAPSIHLPQKETQILIGKKIELSETYSPMGLHIVDSMLIFQCYGDDYKFHVYNKNTLKLIGKFGQEGRGPSEYLLPFMMKQKYKIRDSAYLLIYDDAQRRFDYVNILRAINTRNYHPKSINSRDRLISQLSLVMTALVTDDSLFIGTAGDRYYNEGRFFCYNILRDKMRWEPFYPVTKEQPHETRKNKMYQNYIALRPDGRNIASATSYFERIDILDNIGKLQRSVIFENTDGQDFSVPVESSPPKGAHYYFTSISVSQDYIYGLNYDRVIGDNKIIDTASLVKITWDEKGKPPEILKLTPLVFEIAVDEESNRIFGIRQFSSTLIIYEFGKQF